MGACASNSLSSQEPQKSRTLIRSKKYEDVLHKCEQVRSKVEWIQKTEGLSEEERSQLHDIEVRRQFNRLLSDSGSALAPAPPHDPTHLDRYREVTFHIPDDDDYFAYPPPPVGSAEASMVGTPAAVDYGSGSLTSPFLLSEGGAPHKPMRTSNSLSLLDDADDIAVAEESSNQPRKSDSQFALAMFIPTIAEPTHVSGAETGSPRVSLGHADTFVGADPKNALNSNCSNNNNFCTPREKLNTSVTSVSHRSILKKGSEKELLSTTNLENSVSQRSIGSARVRFGEVEVN